ncbi:hypothetical protein [Sphingomonas sanxanigenens]|uniref:PH domain-containing protein n=1 Tax=Sphingomonas sanxanigenens DSM 19645 = NX02 TaxID=1123269 RepID=W0AG16_9SPHN|nr:hypothetical protein [Sphingomonas sanxanigenens]AHE52602.1 hypothetical protein NX02_04270 [Sphingomonas sanxanigenens DSM 19645 = NX02]AHE56041.1 hypothetical protein NX02_22075 [Sphingomonas sanxanigenens DSM 19645 = NX02]
MKATNTEIREFARRHGAERLVRPTGYGMFEVGHGGRSLYLPYATRAAAEEDARRWVRSIERAL